MASKLNINIKPDSHHEPVRVAELVYVAELVRVWRATQVEIRVTTICLTSGSR